MERLTYRDAKGECWYSGGTVADHLHRLCDIEDILGPTYDLTRLRELVEADRAGMIPCHTIGDTVFDRYGRRWEVQAVMYVQVNGVKRWLYRLGHKGTRNFYSMYQDEILTYEDALSLIKIGDLPYEK